MNCASIMNCARVENFMTCCRLCLGHYEHLLVDCLDVAELCEAVEEVFGFQVLKEDKCTTKVCRDCVMKVTSISMYRNFVIHNQKCIRQYSTLQTKISNIPTIIKLEDDDEDDDVVFIPSIPEPSTSSIVTTSQQNNRSYVSPDSSMILHQKPRVRETARKRTTRLPSNLQLKKLKLCPKRLRVECSYIQEQDVENVFLISSDKKTLKITGKVRPKEKLRKNSTQGNSNAQKPESSEDNKTLFEIRSEMLAQTSTSEDNKTLFEIRSEMLAQPSTSEDNKTLFEIRSEMLAQPSTSKTVMPKVIYQIPSRLSTLLTSTSNDDDKTSKKSNKSLNRKSTQQNAIDPAITCVQSNASSTSPKAIAHSSNSIISADGITVNSQFIRKPMPPPQVLNANSFVSIPVGSIASSSRGNNFTSTATSTSVVIFSTPIPVLRNSLPSINTVNTNSYIVSPPRANIPIYSQSNLTITNPRTISYQSEDAPVVFEQSTNGNNNRASVARSSSACSNASDRKVKILSVTELNDRASHGNDVLPSTSATATNSTNSLKLPIKITMVRIRDEMQIKLANWNNHEVNVKNLNESEKNAVRSSLMTGESRKQFSMAIKTSKPDKVSLELLRTLDLTKIFLNE